MIITKEYLDQFQSNVGEEVWRCHPTEPRLSVSSYGNVKRNKQTVTYMRATVDVCRHLEERMYEVTSTTGGYLAASHPYSCSQYVHRLVGETFIPNESSRYLEVDHIDNNRKNPYVSNLQWLTRSQNIDKAIPNMITANTQKARSVIDITSGHHYSSLLLFSKTLPDYSDTSKDVETYVRNHMNHFGGYLPKYDTIIRYSDSDPIEDITKHKANMLRKILGSFSKKQCVHAVETELYFPSCRNADDYFHLSYGMCSESIKHDRCVCKGRYKLEYIPWNDVPDSVILSMRDYVVWHSIRLRGNGKGGNQC